MSTPYKRAYKACDRCRKNKSKCALEPNATRCTRCVREQIECNFPAQRSAKRVRISRDLGEANETTSTENQSTNPLQSHGTGTTARRVLGGNANQESHQTWRPSDPEKQARLSAVEDQTSQASNNLPHQVLNTIVTNSRDAIDLLFRAADHNDSDNSDPLAASEGDAQDEILGSMLSVPSPALASNETLSLWAQHRFVRQGWFTPREAISYIEFFFQNLSALSPVADSYYADHKNHKLLILEEPLLCCTILMIASRYHVPSKDGGRARSDFVHNRLWRHIEHLIQRIIFGAEKYSIAKTRTVGSIQALLLIIEWHPRALHFPPENDGWDASLAATTDGNYQQQNTDSQASKRWREDVFEPAKRSDRMSWMLVGVATTLAHELGVFNHDESTDNQGDRRAWLRVRRLLFVYTSQLSLRLGCTSTFPHSSQQNITYEPGPGATEQATEDRELLVTKWIEITKLMTTANEMLFANRAAIQQIFKSSRYISLLEHFDPLLRRWHTDFQALSCPTISHAARLIILVEYHFVRMYINSIAVQALVERASHNNLNRTLLDHDFMRSEFSHDFRFVKEVKDASVEILQTATKLSELSMLQYCPVRFFLRVVAASIYLLKTISLGSREADVTRSLGHLERCISALKASQADDIHLSSRYATLIARHVRHFRRNFQVKKAPAAFSKAPSRGPDVVLAHSGRDLAPSNRREDTTARPTDSEGPGVSFGDSDLMLDFDEDGFIEDWLAQPFNTQFAPFGTDGVMPASGLAVDSLDFLWNMTT